MSNYEKYIRERKSLEAAISAIYLSIGWSKDGIYDSNNDKHELYFSVGEMGYGFYGSSSYYKIDSPVAKQYLIAACKELRVTIVEKAVSNIRKQIEELRKSAEDEAKSVLEEISAGVESI